MNIKNDFKFVEIKYIVKKNEKLMKLAESLKASPPQIDMLFNRIDCGDFISAIFNCCDNIVPYKNETEGEETNEAIDAKSNEEKETCEALHTALKTLMTVYNTDEFHTPLRSH